MSRNEYCGGSGVAYVQVKRKGDMCLVNEKGRHSVVFLICIPASADDFQPSWCLSAIILSPASSEMSVFISENLQIFVIISDSKQIKMIFSYGGKDSYRS